MAHIVKLPSFKQQGHGSGLLARSIASRWVQEFEKAFSSHDFGRIASIFVENAWIRDFLTFSWDFRTIQGRDNIIQYFANNWGDGFVHIRLQGEGAFQPSFKNTSPGLQWVESMIVFETRYGRGKGMIRLVLDNEESQQWKGYLINFTLQELKGQEEKTGLDRPHGYVDPAGGNWQQRRDRERDFVDEEPVAFVVGAGSILVLYLEDSGTFINHSWHRSSRPQHRGTASATWRANTHCRAKPARWRQLA
jgi:hypothetical protein